MESNLYRYILRHSLWHQVFLTAIICVLASLNPLVLNLQKRIVNHAIQQGDLPALLWLCAGFLLVVLVAGGLKYVKQSTEGSLSETLLRDLRADLFDRLLRVPPRAGRTRSAAPLIATMLAEVEDLGQFFGEAFSVPLYYGLLLLGTVGYLVVLNPWMALAGVSLYPIQLWLIPKLQRRISDLSRERITLVRGLSERIHDSVSALEDPSAAAGIAGASGSFRAHLQDILRVRMRTYHLKYLTKWINNFLAKLGPLFLLLVGGWLIITRPGSFDVGSLVAFLVGYEQLNEPWRELLASFQQRELAKVKYEQVIAIFEGRPASPSLERREDPLPSPIPRRELRPAFRFGNGLLHSETAVPAFSQHLPTAST
ncbi:MAG: ABC transporter ATP-binding protein [candidate division NC10 bacterium]|nr:ABC transporter ATP-binding protein [candidate division NC10 bacterium]